MLSLVVVLKRRDELSNNIQACDFAADKMINARDQMLMKWSICSHQVRPSSKANGTFLIVLFRQS